MQKPKPQAFSLLELAIVLLIIGIIIAGIIAANGVINRARIATARSLTQTAPINTLSDVTFWFESSLVTSFNGNEDSNGASVNYWYDNKASVNKNNATAGSTPPTYSNTINRIHALAFDGTNSSMTVNASALNSGD